MHIHGVHLNPNIASFGSITAAERQAEARRAAEVRRKLRRASSAMIQSLDADDELNLRFRVDPTDPEAEQR